MFMFDRELLSFIAGFVIASVVIVAACILFRFDFRSLSQRVDELEDDLNNLEDGLEGFIEFLPDGTVVKVNSLFIDCPAVDIDKPTE